MANTLDGKKFVITGEFEFIKRNDAKKQILKFGGKVTGSVSGKTNALIVGSDPGKSKLSKADNLGTPKINEMGLRALLKGSPLEDILEDSSLCSGKTAADASEAAKNRSMLSGFRPVHLLRIFLAAMQSRSL